MSLGSRFAATWEGLAGIGRDRRTGGYRRSAWTGADAELREWFGDQARRRGLDVERDRNGNLWAWWGRPGPGAVVTGSHLDSVPDGGAFDGPLGVVSGFLALDELRARGAQPRRPVAVVCFGDEEGARFGVACAGSRLLTGSLDPDRARGLRDADGVSMAEAMARAGVDPAGLGRDEEALGRIGTLVELHVEQGRELTLAGAGAPVGLATSIWPHGRWRLTFQGRGDHAGTTALADRRDPVLPLARTVLAARELAGAAGAVATVGRVEVHPNATNAIPSRVRAWLDARGPQGVVDALVEDVAAAARRAGDEHGVEVEVSEESLSPAVELDAGLRARLDAVLGGVPAVPTGAGHDAGVLSAAVPAAMLFVRNPTGVSHSPAEHADEQDCVAGVHALAAVLEDLACA